MQKLWKYKFVCSYEENSNTDTLQKKFFDNVYLEALKEVYLCEINNTFNIPSAFTRLFTHFEDLYDAIIESLYESDLKHFYRDRQLHYSLSLNYHPKTSLESPILELEINYYSHLNKVFEDIPSKSLKLRLKDYVR